MAHPKKVSTNFPALLGVFMVSSLSAAGSVGATDNPFVSTRLAGGYMLAEADATADANSDKAAEGKCGGKSEKEAVCGMYVVGSAHEDESKVKDGKCGGHKAAEGLCGGAR